MRDRGGSSEDCSFDPHYSRGRKHTRTLETAPKATGAGASQHDPEKCICVPRPGDPFEARDPSAITRHMKRFIKSAGLPDVSPHDLRHTCASLLLSSGADIKSVQEILGHADASTTLNFYVKTDLRQMRVATDRYAKAFGL